MKNNKKIEKNATSTTFFITNSKWQVVTDCYWWKKKVISVMGSNRISNNLILRICYKNIVNITLLTKKNVIHRISQYFSQ